MLVLPTTAESQAEDALTVARALVVDLLGAAQTASALQSCGQLVVYDERHRKTSRGILYKTMHRERVSTRRGVGNDVCG
jgi:hypothetical protein